MEPAQGARWKGETSFPDLAFVIFEGDLDNAQIDIIRSNGGNIVTGPEFKEQSVARTALAYNK